MSIEDEKTKLQKNKSEIGHMIKALHKEEAICRECGQCMPRIYKYHLDDSDVSLLLKIWHSVIRLGINDIDVREANLSHTERDRVTQLRFHAMIAKVKNNKGKQVPAHWLLTKRGCDFLKGKITTSKYVLTSKNQVIGHSPEQVSRKDFKILNDFGPHFEWEIVEGDYLKKQIKQGVLI